MGLNTDFNQSPYFDDFDETNNYHRVLFKPAVAVQARELTQLQTILQNQIERFGNNILTEGTIVQGGNFVEEENLAYVKVRDIATTSSGTETPTDVNLYVGMKAVGQVTGLEAIIIATEFGLESQSPNLNTIFVKYTKGALSGNTNISKFSSTEEINLYPKDAVTGSYSTTVFHKLTAAGNVSGETPTTAVNNGYGVRCGEGIIYQKGHFIRFTDALTIVSKYSNAPDGVVVGFQTAESIVDYNSDSTLLDNANGFNNENAPGADRLQLIPSLAVLTTAQAAADDTFFSVQEYVAGRVVRRKTGTQYSTISRTMEQRTSEESGNYVVNKFPVRVGQSLADANNLSVFIGKGLGYVDGRRVELLNEISIDIPEANTTSSITDQNINANYGQYVIVNGYTGKFDFTSFESVNIKNSGGTTIGTAKVRSVTRDSTGVYRLYLFAIKMGSGYSFKNARTIAASVSTGSANTVLVSNNSVLVDVSFSRMFFETGKPFVSTITAANYTYRTSTTQTVGSGTNTFTISPVGSDTFPYTSSLTSDQIKDLIIVSDSSATASPANISVGEVLEVTSASVAGTILTINLAKTPASGINITVYFNAVRSGAITAVRNAKTLETAYVKFTANTLNAGNTTGTYILGLPDAYSLEGVWKVASGVADATLEGYATANSSTANFSSYFKLQPRQFDDYYGLSSIALQKSLTITANDKLIAKVKVFKKDATVGHFFIADSYPVDDISSTLPADKIRTENIPAYTGENGAKYYLRDMIDLRPYASNTAAYAVTASAATLNPVITETFSPGKFIAPNAIVQTDFNYYLGRNDIVIIDKNGEFAVVQGTPSDNPAYPQEPTKGMLLARMNITPFPSLPSAQANAAKKPDYGIAISSNQTKRYTMSEIGGIEKRLGNLEYYTSLSLLETSARDFMVTDATGANRFKNGIFVDNFDDLTLADVNGGEFAAAIDPSNLDIHPKFRQHSLGLKVASLTNATNFNNVAVTLPKTDYYLESTSQPYATNYKNCVTSFYSYAGKMSITPGYDSGPDTVKAPDVNIEIDLATPFIEFTEALSEIIPMTRTQTQRISRRMNQVTTTTLETGAGEAVTNKIGDFVTDVNFSSFMRSRNISVYIVGLRPLTRFYFFFDGKNVDAHVAKASVDQDLVSGGSNNPFVATSGFGGQVITSDANGTVTAIFRIPAETFYVGDRVLEVLDVPLIADRDAATSTASSTYSGFNFSASKTTLSTITRPPSFTIEQTVTNVRRRGGSDPVAQTFIIDKDTSADTDVFVSKIDLYFAKKSNVGNGVGIQIREVTNGYPDGNEIPFSSVYLTASQVNAPTTSVANNTTAYGATTVTFKAPIALKTDTEYAIVIAPDANDPDYLVWISRTGGVDVDSNLAVTQDSNAGVLFTSTNNKTWTPYQNENLKFKLYGSRFTSATGTLKLTNNDHEFLSVQNVAGGFLGGEYVFTDKTSSFAAGTVTITAGNTTVNGTSTTFLSSYTAGQAIVVKIGASAPYAYQVLKIKSIQSNTVMTLQDVPTVTATGNATHYQSAIGKLIEVNNGDPQMIILEESTASSTVKFVTSTTVIGAASLASASVTAISNLPISYIQPAIYRTNFTQTSTTLRASKLYNGVDENDTKNLAFNDTNYLYENTYYIKSKSNDPASSGFELEVTLKNASATTKDTSPVIDHEISSVLLAEYRVNDIAANDITERGRVGAATSKYVSKIVKLADGMDATHVRVLIGAYKPVGTELRVYMRLQSSTDIRAFSDVQWTELTLKPETDARSSTANRYDYRDYEYYLGTTSKAAGEGAWDNSGVINYIDLDGAVYTSFKYFAVKIVMESSGHNVVPRVKDLRALALT
jgi:hypothetical protein